MYNRPHYINVYRRKKAKRASGLKILERGGNTEQHFAKLRAIACNLAAQDQLNRDTDSKTTPFAPFRHAQPDSQGPMHAATGAENDRIHSGTSILPRVLDKPNKPTKQNRLSELVETAVRNIESLDAKRAHISSMDPKTLVGLDITSRKRKYGIALDGQDQMTTKPFCYPTEARPRAFAASPSPQPPIMVDTCAERVEDMLSFGTPSDRQSASSTQVSIVCSNGKTRDEQTVDQSQTFTDVPRVSTTPTESQSSTTDIDIPPTLYEDAFRAAAQTLKVQDALLGVQTSKFLTPWHTQSSDDDSEIRAFNLFMPTQVSVLDGTPLDPEPRTTVTFQDERNLQNGLSNPPGKKNGREIGNQSRSSLRQDRQDHNRHTGSGEASHPLLKPHGRPRIETPQLIEPLLPLAPRKPTGKARGILSERPMTPSPLDGYFARSHPSHLQRTSGQVTLSSDCSDVYGKVHDREPNMTANSALRLNNSCSTWDFASVQSSPRSSQEDGASFTTGNGNNRTIGLQLFDDHPQASVQVGT